MEDTLVRPYISANRLFFKQYRDKTYCYGCPSKLTDARDGQTYDVVCIGNQTWMAENLNYNTPGSYCYSNTAGNCATYGRLYEWNTAMNGASATNQNPSGVQGVCPAGWHVPSFSEWLELMTYVGVQTAGGSLRLLPFGTARIRALLTVLVSPHCPEAIAIRWEILINLGIMRSSGRQAIPRRLIKSDFLFWHITTR